MRFLKMLLRYFIFGGIAFSLVGFLLIQVFLFINAIEISDSFSKAKRLAKKPDHVSDCIVVSGNDEYPIKGYQIRFKDEKEYVVEALCTSSVKGPFEVSSNKLTFGVKKEAGFSGVLFPTVSDGNIDGRIVISLWKFKWLIEVGDVSKIIFSPLFTSSFPDPGVDSSLATCEGWGYQCCNVLTQVGDGEKISESVSDCDQECFSTCKERPSILIFTSDPEMSDPRDRTVHISKKEPLVLFSYSVQDVDSESVGVEITFGDGESAQSTNQTDQFSHFYACNKPRCVYTANLKIVDSDGYEQARTRISQIRVLVK